MAFLRILARPSLLLYLLPWLMFLLAAGTISQRYIGLFASEKLFFGSYLFWLGPMPLPGIYSVLALMALSLSAKLLLESPWKQEQAGVIIAHASIIMLLLGGLITSHSRQDAYMVLGQGESSDLLSDYHRRELAIFKNGAVALIIPYEDLSKGKHIHADSLPFDLRIETVCRNCEAVERRHPSDRLRGTAAAIDLRPAPLLKQDEENLSGITFDVEGARQAAGTYIAFESMLKPPAITIGKDQYGIVMRRAQRLLPFSLRLVQFERNTHPATDIAASYRSLVTVKDDGMEWNAPIEMNAPLNYKGYTIYQSSFLNEGGKEKTVLAVVRNSGKLFPYMALGFFCTGLLLHLIIVLRSRTDSKAAF